MDNNISEFYTIGAVGTMALLYVIGVFNSNTVKINPIGIVVSAAVWPLGLPYSLFRLYKINA